MNLGLGLGMGFGGAPSGPPPFDPGTLALTLYLDGSNYAGSGVWNGEASAGTSGTHATTSSGADPTVGASLNGIPTVAFNGTTQYLLTGLPISTFLTAAAWSGWALVNCAGASNYAATYDGNPCFFSDATQGYFNVGVRRAGASPGPATDHGVYQYGGASVEATFTGGAWALLQWRYDGTNIGVRTNAGIWVESAQPSIENITYDLQIGANYNASFLYNGLIASIGMSKIAFDDATFENIRKGLNARFGLSL